MIDVPTRSLTIKSLISLAALVLLVLHLALPEVRIDSITIGLFFVGVLPWLAEILKSAKLPGGWEIEFRELQSAAQKALSGASDVGADVEIAPVTPGSAEAAMIGNFGNDPNLALAAMRIEIEKRLRRLAERVGVSDVGLDAATLLRLLRERGVLDTTVASGLTDLVSAGNRAAHGAKVPPEVAEWASREGQRILSALDLRIGG